MTLPANTLPTPPTLHAPPPAKPLRRIAIGTLPHLQDATALLWIAYLPEFRHWEITFRPVPALDHDWIKRERYDGYLFNCWTQADDQYLHATGIPAVNTSGLLDQPLLPTVKSDNHLIGQLAARHLMHDCALQHLAYSSPGINTWRGNTQNSWRQQRGDAFVHAVEKAGLTCHLMECNLFCGPIRLAPPSDEYIRWIDQLPKPVGIFAGDDWMSLAVLSACSRLGLHVPNDVAILGVNNDQICTMTTPTLSSINRNFDVLLLQAARLLDRLLDGHPAPPQPILIPPAGIIKRQSTQVLAVDDPAIAAATRLIRENPAETFTVESLAEKVGIHRRTLLRGFNRNLHCAPLEYLVRARVERAKSLLTGSAKIAAIAAECGFTSDAQFRSTFKRIAGITPRQYRDNAASASRLTHIHLP